MCPLVQRVINEKHPAKDGMFSMYAFVSAGATRLCALAHEKLPSVWCSLHKQGKEHKFLCHPQHTLTNPKPVSMWKRFTYFFQFLVDGVRTREKRRRSRYLR